MRIIIACLVVILLAALVVGGMVIFRKKQMSKISGLTFTDALKYTTHDNPNAIITVGIIQNGQASYAVYGENGKVLPAKSHVYEIGSLTKTFTAAMINRAVSEEKIGIDDTVDQYLTLPAGNNYPTIKDLLTHTSGYKGYYYESPMASNFFKGRNHFCGITKDMVLNKVGRLSINKGGSGFCYSNFGYAVLGLVLENVYGTDYTKLLNDFAQNELGLRNTHISDRHGDLANYWDWKPGDAYISAGAVTSNIDDMLRYARMQLEVDAHFADCHTSLKTINVSAKDYESMGIHMDDIGMAWIIDNKNGIVWHNGGTGDYNSYFGFKPESGTAVVILSNLSPFHRIPSTVLGVKLLLELSD